MGRILIEDEFIFVNYDTSFLVARFLMSMILKYFSVLNPKKAPTISYLTPLPLYEDDLRTAICGLI